MAGFITRAAVAAQGQEILNQATRASQQFKNAAQSLGAQLRAFETTALPTANFDQETLDEIATLKAAKIAQVRADIASAVAELDALEA